MTKPSKERPISEALQLQGRAQEIIRRIDTPEKAAEFYVKTIDPLEAVSEIMGHVKSMLMLEARQRPVQVGSQFVSAEPYQYTYDIAAVKELAPECIVQKEVATSDKMQRINELAGAALNQQLSVEGAVSREMFDEVTQRLEEIVKLSQPEVIEAVDPNKLRAILGRGDYRAQELAVRKVKTPVNWKLVVREGVNADR